MVSGGAATTDSLHWHTSATGDEQPGKGQQRQRTRLGDGGVEADVVAVAGLIRDEQLRALDQDARPATTAAHEAALEAYNAQQSDYLTVLDAERTLLALRNQRLDAAAQYHNAIITLEQLTAGSVSDKP